MNRLRERSLLLALTGFLSLNLARSGGIVDVSPKITVDVSGSHKASAFGMSGSLGVNTGVSLGVEVGRNLPEVFNFGVGLAYLFPREQEISGSGKFSFIPIYAILRLSLVTGDANIVPSIVGNLGYNAVFDGDGNYRGPWSLSGGLYAGGGLRLDFSSVFLEGQYKMFNGSASISNGYSGASIDVTYTTFALGFGVLL